jgi:hypothetical protein
MRKWIERIIAFISALFILWGVVSFIEVNCKNLTENPTYWEGNMFIYLMEIWGE